jgi:hypothetical protein
MRQPCTEPGCDYVAEGPERGAGSVPWRMAVHRKKHRKPGERPITTLSRVERLERLMDDLMEHLHLEEGE